MDSPTKPLTEQEQKDEELIVTETGTDRITEAFRIMRGNLDYVLPPKENGEGNVIQFTSTVPGEGKSFSAANLAITCAINGKRVIAVDITQYGLVERTCESEAEVRV